jgi:signal transduction histidine kinase
MIFSQLMLSGFVVYWLINQYNDEKDLLNDELSRLYDESCNQVIDSLLFNVVVEPALSDSVTITMVSKDRVDTVNHKVTGSFKSGTLHVTKDTCKTSMIAVKLPDSLERLKAGTGTAFSFTNKKQDLLIRSVKMFINHTGDSMAGMRPLAGFLPGMPDTNLFRKIFTEKVGHKKLGILISWNGEIVRNVKMGGLHFSSPFQSNFPEVEIKHDFPYLIRRLVAQILFALILLLLTGSAFYYTNRGLKRQVILNNLRNDFVSNITHELRTPVSTVKVALEALKTFDKVNNPEVTRDYLDMAGQELNRLDQLISKVLDQSLIGDQKQVVQAQPVDLKHLIESTLLTLQPRFTARDALVKFESSDISDQISVDPLHFQGVLINLIDNSLKYGPENPEILIRLRQEKGSVFVEVSDNGPGIPKEYLGRVFDKFFRVPKGDTHNIKGYGLGLSFAALVMKQHGGSITVKNLEGEGCVFTLRFPVKSV